MPRLQGSSNNGSFLYVDYAIGSPNLPGKYIDVAWTVGVHWGTYYFNIHDAEVHMHNQYGTIGLTTSTGTYNSGWPISGAGPNRDHAFKSGTTRVFYSAGGNGNITFNGSANWDTPSNFTSTISKIVALPSIGSLPGAPTKPVISAIMPTSATLTWSPGTTGGSAITGYQIGYGLSPSSPATIVSATSPKTISGLTPGTTYYFWVRALNAVGTGPWSSSVSNVTLAGVRIRIVAMPKISWELAVPYVRVGGVWKVARPWVRDAGTWKETT